MANFKLLPTLFLLAFLSKTAFSTITAVYARGETYPAVTANYVSNIQALKDSGFNTVLIWCIHVESNADLIFNDHLIIHNGNYVGHPDWPNAIAGLVSGSITRVYFSVGSWGSKDFRNIHNLLQDTATKNQLKQNFQRLAQLVPGLYGIDLDNEDYFDNNDAVVDFGVMMGELDLKVSFCVYDKIDYWMGALKAIDKKEPGLVTAIFAQIYDGGALNDPLPWTLLSNVLLLLRNPPKVYPGLWCLHNVNGGTTPNEGDSPSDVEQEFALRWKVPGIQGGFIWNFSDILTFYTGDPGDYADAIYNGLN